MSWKTRTENYYLVGESEEVDFDTTNDLSSPVITDDVGGKKTIAGIDITTAGTNATAPLKMQLSWDKENWVDGATLASNLDTSEKGIVAKQVDLSDLYAPYYRLVIEPGATIGDAGKVKFFFTNKPNQQV